jgi:prevent-host-death family protein
MDDLPRKGAEEARSQLPSLLEQAEAGRSTLITRHGRPVAVVAPVASVAAAGRQAPLTPLAGSGRGLWGEDSAATIAELRGEWPG